MKSPIVIETARTTLIVPDVGEAGLVLDYYLENRDHLCKWEPKRTDDFYTIETWQALLSENSSMVQSGTALKFLALNKAKNEVIGICSFTNIVHGIFQACNLGYSVSKKYEGLGYMTEILGATIEYMFDVVGLHRIMANYVPENSRSAAVLHRLGFEKEGFAKSYLKINGQWRDHVLASKLNPNYATTQN